MGRHRYVHGSAAELRDRSLPSLFEFDPATHVPQHPGQRAAINSAGSNVNGAPIGVRDYQQLGRGSDEAMAAYLLPKSYEPRTIPVEQLPDHSDAQPMPVDENGSELKRS